MKNRVLYLEICDNFEDYRKIKTYKFFDCKIKNKTINQKINKIIEAVNMYKFQIMTKFNLIQKIEKSNKVNYIIYKKERKEAIILKKIEKILKRERNEKVVLSKKIKEIFEKNIIQKKNDSTIKMEKNNLKRLQKESQIQNLIDYYKESKVLYKDFVYIILNNIIKLKKETPEEQSIYILIKSDRATYINQIINMIPNYKMINIVTPNTKKFAKIENNLENSAEIITVLNNKRKSLSRAKYIINIDFEEEEILQYNINRTAIIFNTHYTRVNIRNFDGSIINNIKLKTSNLEKFDIQDEYVANLNENLKKEVLEYIKEYNYSLIGNNSIIDLDKIEKMV